MNMDILLLFSGGKDSLLSAARLAEDGWKVRLAIMDNGCIVGINNAMHGIRTLQDRYGKDRVVFGGIHGTAAAVQDLSDPWAAMSAQAFGDAYPTLRPAQVCCLHCQTAMWAVAAAYAKAHRIHAAAAGYKDTDVFCTGCSAWTDRIRDFLKANRVNMVLPVWDTAPWGSDQRRGRNMEMLTKQLVPAVLEPKCVLGRPATKMRDIEIQDMVRYFDTHLASRLQPLTDRFEKTFRSTPPDEN